MKYEEITNLVPIYNTPKEYLIPCLNSCISTGSPLVIVDDCSEQWCLDLINDFISSHDDLNIKFYKTPKNLYLPGALNFGSKFINTKYIRRVDSDDKVKKVILPDGEFDTLFDKCGSADLITYLRAPTLFCGVIMKTEIFKKVYSDYTKFVPYQLDYFEDMYFLLLYFIKENGANLINCCSTERSYFYTVRKDSMSKHKKYMDKFKMRHGVLNLLSEFYGLDNSSLHYYVDTPLKNLNGDL